MPYFDYQEFPETVVQKIREKFELWCKDNGEPIEKDKLFQYVDDKVKYMWIGFKAARILSMTNQL